MQMRVSGQIAQLVEHEPEELGVLGSIPSLSSYEMGVRLLHESRLVRLKVGHLGACGRWFESNRRSILV